MHVVLLRRDHAARDHRGQRLRPLLRSATVNQVAPPLKTMDLYTCPHNDELFFLFPSHRMHRQLPRRLPLRGLPLLFQQKRLRVWMPSERHAWTSQTRRTEPPRPASWPHGQAAGDARLQRASPVARPVLLPDLHDVLFAVAAAKIPEIPQVSVAQVAGAPLSVHRWVRPPRPSERAASFKFRRLARWALAATDARREYGLQLGP
jgi:hypothetical protein